MVEARDQLNESFKWEELRGGVREGIQREGERQSVEGELQLRLKTPFMKVFNSSRREEERSCVDGSKEWFEGRLRKGASKEFFDEELRRRNFQGPLRRVVSKGGVNEGL